jgi:hypothetical protein
MDKKKMEISLQELLVPKEILLHFDFERVEKVSGIYRVHLVEKRDSIHIPKTIVYKGRAVLDGYMNPIELQTFPTRATEVFLLLKRRKWKEKVTTKHHFNTYNFTNQGLKATKEFSSFLKEIGR